MTPLPPYFQVGSPEPAFRFAIDARDESDPPPILGLKSATLARLFSPGLLNELEADIDSLGPAFIVKLTGFEDRARGAIDSLVRVG
jgi:hypothetical protein